MSAIDIFKHFLSGNDWQELTEFAVFNYYNRGYSCFNSALLLLQKPGATLVKSEHLWSKEERYIKPEATPLVILRPGGPVALVYDYSDTYSEKDENENLREALYREYMDRKMYMLTEYDYLRMCENLNKIGVIFEEKPFGERQGGLIAPLARPLKTCYIKYDRHNNLVTKEVDAYYKIVINSNYNVHEKSLALMHELGHLFCGHVPASKPFKSKVLPTEFRTGLSADSMEYEAELACRLVCEYFSLINNCQEYLQQHMTNGTVPFYSKSAVISAVDKISGMIYK